MIKTIINNQYSQYLYSFLLPLLSVLVLILSFIALNTPIMETLWRYSFDDGTYSHAYLIPVIILYLYYLLAREGSLLFREKISWPSILLFIISGYFLFVSSTAQISFAYWIASLMTLSSAFTTLFKTNLKTLFPLGYFVFLIPIWGVLTEPLQNISIYVVNFIMSMTTIPVYVENQFVHIPAGIFEIADGCSGLRYLITSLAISSLYAFLFLRTTKSIFIFFTTAILGALVTNWLRITALIMIGHYTDMTSSLMTDHNMFGWYLYIPFMFLLFKLGNKLTENTEGTSSVKSYTQLKTNSKPLLSIVILVFFVLAFSSTSFHTQQYNITGGHKTLNTNLMIFPEINYYSSVEKVIDTPQNTYLIYHFTNTDLDEKPTFYNNNLIPTGWKITKQEIINSWQVLYLQKQEQLAILTISYEISDIKKPTANTFKIERLKQAFSGKKSIKLHWKFEKIKRG